MGPRLSTKLIWLAYLPVVVVVLLLLLVTATRTPARTAAAPIPIRAASEKNGAPAPAAGAGGRAAASGRLSGVAGAASGAGASEAAPPDVAPPDVAPPLSPCAKALAVAEKSKAPPAKIDNNFRCMTVLPQNDVTADSA